MGGTCGSHERYEKCKRNFDRKISLEKSSLKRIRLRWNDRINMDLRETGFEDVDWIQLI
jgi:hypothetical protein